MVKKRKHLRKLESLVPPIQLGWVQTHWGRDWTEPQASALEIASKHFEYRQSNRGVRPLPVNPKLKRAIRTLCVLFDTHPDVFHARPAKYSNEWLQSKIAKDVRLFRLQKPKSITNLELFHQNLEKLKQMAHELTVPEWYGTAVAVPIGPEKILKFISEEVHPTLGHRRFATLTYNNHNTSVIFVEAKHDAELAQRHVAHALGPCYSQRKELEMSAPNSGYAMRLKYGQEPEYIGSTSESPYVICIDDVKIPHNPSKYGIRKNTESRLRSKIRSTRLMTIPEKRWVENRTKRTDLIDKGLRIVEFYTPEEKNKCLERAERLKVIDLMYNPMMFNQEEVYETAFLKIQYDIRAIHREGVKVTVVYESDKDFTEAAFTGSGLRVFYFNENNKTDDNVNLRLSPNVKSMVCQEFPCHLRTFDDHKWYIELIAAKNRLELEAIEPHVEEVDYARKSVREAWKQDIRGIIDYEIYKIAHHNNVFRPMDMPWDVTRNGGRGARHYADIVMTRPDVPWHSTRVNTGPKRADEQYMVHFKSADEGIAVIRDIVKLSYTEPVFRCDKSDGVGPQLTPVYRKTTPITRRMRAAFNTSIHDFDDTIRYTFPALSNAEDPLMEVPEAQFYSIRVYEEWTDSGETGLIGVEGWNTNGVRHFFGRLQKLLKPVEFPAAEELLCGIGEIWVKNHEKHFDVMIDIDKFRGIISIFGTRAQEVVEELQTYEEKKSKIIVNTRLPTFFPLFNDYGRSLLDVTTLQNMSSNLNAKAVLDPKTHLIEFQGTIEAYLEFTKALDTISAEVFKRLTRIESMECPVCFCETDVTSDFFRFHCGHEMCRGCLNNMVSTRINDSEMRIQCSHEGCSAYLTPQELLSIILGGEDRLRELDSLKLSKMMARAKETLVAKSEGAIASCPTADCVGILIKSPGDLQEFKSCQTCDRIYCRQCLLEPHADNTCEEYVRLRQPDHSIATYVKQQKNTKKCPKCGIWVQKTAGCNHILCKCGAHFCWACLFAAEDGPTCYAHMQNEHRNFGGEFQLVDGQMQAADPANEELQLELGIQQLMLGDHDELVANRDIPLDRVPLNRDPRFAVNEVVRPREFPLVPPGLAPLNIPPGLPPLVIPPIHGPPVLIPPPMPLDELPQELIDEFPDFFTIPHIQEHALIFLNDVANIQERWNNMEELRRWPEEYDAAPTPPRND